MYDTPKNRHINIELLKRVIYKEGLLQIKTDL